ncbi:MAG: type II secretion system minor pseudopilin GspI [Marinobacter sp.]|nr:type II secretion system minor pseudopilin GspI [Marinobacter sp.]
MISLHRQARGFTLVEVLVALLVFALVATAAAEVGSQNMATFERVRERTLAQWVADNKLNELRLEESLPSLSENRQDVEFANRRWQVHTRVSGTEEPSIRRVDVTVLKYSQTQRDPQQVHVLSGFLGAN